MQNKALRTLYRPLIKRYLMKTVHFVYTDRSHLRKQSGQVKPQTSCLVSWTVWSSTIFWTVWTAPEFSFIVRVWGSKNKPTQRSTNSCRTCDN